MFELISSDQIDRAKWDSCIQSSKQAIIYAESWYLDAVSDNWSALIIQEQGEYMAVLPLPWKRKFGIKYVYQPFFTQQLGFFSESYLLSEVREELFANLTKKFKYLSYCLNENNEPLKVDGIVNRINCTLSLHSSYDEIIKSYNSNRKRDLKKAIKNNLIVQESYDINSLIKLFIQNKGEEVSELKELDYRRLETIYKQAKAHKAAQVLEIKKADHIIGGGFFLKHRSRIIYLFGAVNNEGKKLGAMTLLMDQLIRKNASRNITFDFEGSDIPALRKFYSSFGARENAYQYLNINNLPKYFKWLKS